MFYEPFSCIVIVNYFRTFNVFAIIWPKVNGLIIRTKFTLLLNRSGRIFVRILRPSL